MPAELSAKLLPLGRVVGVERRLEAAGRGRGSPRTDVCVDLPGSAGLIFVVPEVHVVPAFHRLDAEATPDLHAREIELPLHKGNCGVSESRWSWARSRISRPTLLSGQRPPRRDGELVPSAGRRWRTASSVPRTGRPGSNG